MDLDLSDAVLAARNLLGYRLVHESPEGTTSGYIVETEAYMDSDAASHTYRGQTQRNRVMYESAGHMYVYFTYGMHYCANIVTGEKGQGQGVLIRALQPVDGLDLMMQRRGREDHLTDGPAKLAQAMGIGLADSGQFLLGNGSFNLKTGFKPEQVTETTRIGISQAVDLPWRFYITGNPWVSKP